MASKLRIFYPVLISLSNISTSTHYVLHME